MTTSINPSRTDLAVGAGISMLESALAKHAKGNNYVTVEDFIAATIDNYHFIEKVYADARAFFNINHPHKEVG